MNNLLSETLRQIQQYFENNDFIRVESEKIELKSLSVKGGTESALESIGAFLNTNGGILIAGILEKDKEKKYEIVGFDSSHENNIKDIAKNNIFQDKDGRKLLFDIEDYISMSYRHLYDANKREHQILVIEIQELPDDKKYVFIKNKKEDKLFAYRRTLSGDTPISGEQIEAHEEYKKSIEGRKELSIDTEATLSEINIDRLNEYIQRLNNSSSTQLEVRKNTLEEAMSMLRRKKFVLQDRPTVAGLLVCGNYVGDYLQGRAQVDCFFMHAGEEYPSDKKTIRNNIIPMIEEAFAFVQRNTRRGVGAQGGGVSVEEYPEELIRESINNAFAHRDYSDLRYITINIVNYSHIEIKNPGAIKRNARIEIDDPLKPVLRITRIDDAAPNPILANILKIYDKWEGKGIGLAKMVRAALENQIDVPYYTLQDNQTSLNLPTGKTLDESMKAWLRCFRGYINQQLNGYPFTEEQQTVLAYFFKSERLNQEGKYTILLTPDNNHTEAIKTLTAAKLLMRQENSLNTPPIYLVSPNIIYLSNSTYSLPDVAYTQNIWERIAEAKGWDGVIRDIMKITEVYLNPKWGNNAYITLTDIELLYRVFFPTQKAIAAPLIESILLQLTHTRFLEQTKYVNEVLLHSRAGQFTISNYFWESIYPKYLSV